MRTIKKELALLLVGCSILAIVLTWIGVNITVNKQFDKYMIDVQNKKYNNIVEYLKNTYEKNGRWEINSGNEIIHEAYMGNYCLTLYDENKKVIWGMDPNDPQINEHLKHMDVSRGVYSSKTFEIRSYNKIVGYIDIGQYSSLLVSEEDLNFKNSINKSIFISCLITTLIIIVLSLYFSRRFSKPIKEIANTSVKLSNGELNAKFNTNSNIEELENLRNSINSLGEKLNNQDRIRKRLVSDISHEIRTPLNILQNNLEAMIDGIFPVTLERLAELNDEVIRFGKLVDNLNILKTFEGNSLSVKFEKIDLKGIITTVGKEFSIWAKEKDIEIIINSKDEYEYKIIGDKDKIKQVFINLISNAVKFTSIKFPSGGGRVWVNLYKENQNTVVEVNDNGIGINDEDIEFIFESMYRGDKSRHIIEGNGIGLTVVKDILISQSASMEVKSEEGMGSTFRILFD